MTTVYTIETGSSPVTKSRKIRNWRIVPLLPNLPDYIQGPPSILTPILTPGKPEIHLLLTHLRGTLPVPLLPQPHHKPRGLAPILPPHTPILQRRIPKLRPETSQARIIQAPHPVCLPFPRQIRLGCLRRLISQAHSLLIWSGKSWCTIIHHKGTGILCSVESLKISDRHGRPIQNTSKGSAQTK